MNWLCTLIASFVNLPLGWFPVAVRNRLLFILSKQSKRDYSFSDKDSKSENRTSTQVFRIVLLSIHLVRHGLNSKNANFVCFFLFRPANYV